MKSSPGEKNTDRLLENKAIIVILMTVGLDAMGIGLIMPVLPALLRTLVHTNNVSSHYGMFLTIYAVMQFLFAPILGWFSDRFGRRPVLLLALACATLDYTIMSFAPMLWILYVGRLIAGMSSATGSIAAAYMADISDNNVRAKRFGFISACLGIGMIAGPVIGGLAGRISPQMPFMIAAAFNGLNFVSVYFLLPESHRIKNKPDPIAIPYLQSILTWFGNMKVSKAFMFLFFIMQLVGQVPIVIWVLYCENRFHWGTTTIGLSLAWFGILHALVQTFVTGPMVEKFGEKHSIFCGITIDCVGYIFFAFATQGWMVWPITPLLALGGIGTTALQAMLSNQVEEEAQGELQGTLTSLTSLSLIIAPLLFTTIYTALTEKWNGLVWIAGAMLYSFCLPILRHIRYNASATKKR